jgi:hypothetical protein
MRFAPYDDCGPQRQMGLAHATRAGQRDKPCFRDSKQSKNLGKLALPIHE